MPPTLSPDAIDSLIHASNTTQQYGEATYLKLLADVILNGSQKTIFDSATKEPMPDKCIYSLFGRQLRFDLSKGFPLYTTKKVFYRGAFEEMIWFLKGTGNVTDLIQKGVHIWDEWAYKHFQYRMKEFPYSYLAYPPDSTGRLIRQVQSQEELVDYLLLSRQPFEIPVHYTAFTNWGCIEWDEQANEPYEYSIDQTEWIVEQVQKNPDRKSYYVTCWNPARTYQMAADRGLESVVLAACHIDHLVNVIDGRLNLRVGIRSNDLFLGNPFNVAQYALLAHMYAFLTGFPVGELLINIDDAHLYSDHIDQAIEQIGREILPMPQLMIHDRGQARMQDFVFEDFEWLIPYRSHGSLKGEVTVVGGF
ncbi:thymidylate synthase [Chroococcidiopsis sp.]|uniref:thymidylate synthase n=1 Tax=Chroococcidiopsis sp. TaxID=3088168 RepID=UPI003F31F638